MNLASLAERHGEHTTAVGHAGQSLLDPAVTARVLQRTRNGTEQPDGLKSLTDQERRILEFVAQGRTNHEIAQRVFLADTRPGAADPGRGRWRRDVAGVVRADDVEPGGGEERSPTW